MTPYEIICKNVLACLMREGVDVFQASDEQLQVLYKSIASILETQNDTTA